MVEAEVNTVTRESLKAEVEAQWRTLREMEADLRELWLKVTRMPYEGGSRDDSPLLGVPRGH